MKNRHPKTVDALRAELLADDASRFEYLEQRIIARLGGLIARILAGTHRSQSDLARAAGMAQADINALVRGRARHLPTLSTLRRVASALQVGLTVDIRPNGEVEISEGASEAAAGAPRYRNRGAS